MSGDSSRPRPFRSILRPYLDEIRRMRRARHTWREIAEHLTATHGIRIAPPSVYLFFKRAVRRKTLPLGFEDLPIGCEDSDGPSKPKRDLLVIAGLGLLYFIGGAWFVWNDHRAVQKTIYQQVALHTKDALERLQAEYIKEHLDTLKAFVNTGVTVSVVRDSEGDTTLYFQGRPGVSLFNPRFSSGKYAVSVLQ